MGYIYLLLVALCFSLGGTCVKTCNPFFAPSMITFLRFFIGVLWLLGLKIVFKKHFRSDFIESAKSHWKWLAIGALSKFLHYTLENIALTPGVSYGNILTQPVQMILLTILGVTVLHERMTLPRLIGVTLCVAGILLISWNGLSLTELLSGNIRVTILYIIAGIFAGLFVFAQKQTASDFDILDSNLVMLSIASFLGFFVPLGQGNLAPAAPPTLSCILAILFLGFITGIAFYLNAMAIKLVPFQMVALLQSTMVFFAIGWGILLFHESVSIWIISGTILFVIGIVVSQQHKTAPQSKAE